MAVYKRDMVDINLETGNIHRNFLKHSIGYKDQQADHFGIRAYRNGEPVNLTGVSIQGIFMPPQGPPIAITSGNIVNYNEAEVVLPQACYNYDGQFTLAIKLVDPSNAVTGTMRIVDGMVDNTHASGTVAPVAAIPSYQEVLSTYEQAIAAINKTVRFDAVQSLTDTQKATARGNISAPSVADLQAETTAREAADTAINNAIGTVPSGKTVQGQINTLESGKVPKTTTVNGHALSGNVTVTKADVGLGNVDNTSDVNKPVSTAQRAAIDAEAATRAAADADLKSAIGEYGIPYTSSAWENGAIRVSTGADYAGTTPSIRRTEYNGINTGDYYVKAIGDYLLLVYAYNTSGTYVGALQTDGSFANTSTNLAYVKEYYISKHSDYKYRFTLKHEDNSSIAPSDGANVVFYSYTDGLLQKRYKTADAWAIDKRSKLISRTMDAAVGRGHIDFHIGAHIEIDMEVDPSNPPVVDIDNPVKSNYAYAVVECREGDVFTVNCAIASSAYRTLVFIDSNKKFITGKKGSLSNLEVTAPENAAYLVLKTRSELSGTPFTEYYAYKGLSLTESDFKYRGNVTAEGRTSMLECIQNGWYRFTTSDISSITDMPEGDTSKGHILKVYFGALGSPDAILQELLRTDGRNWIRWLVMEGGTPVVYIDWIANVVTNWAEGLKMCVAGHSSPAGTYTSKATAWPAVTSAKLGCSSLQNIAIGGSTVAKSPVIVESPNRDLRKETYEEIYFSMEDFEEATVNLDTTKQYLVNDAPSNDHPFMIYKYDSESGNWVPKYDAHNAANGARAPIVDVIKSLALDADFIVIGAGSNDYTYAYTDLGVFSDRTKYTFYGALHLLLSYLQETYQGKPIFFTDATIYRGAPEGAGSTPNAIGKVYTDYSKAIIEVCNYYGVPFIDMGQLCNIPDYDIDSSWYADDGQHLSRKGHERFGEIMAGKIGNYLII